MTALDYKIELQHLTHVSFTHLMHIVPEYAFVNIEKMNANLYGVKLGSLGEDDFTAYSQMEANVNTTAPDGTTAKYPVTVFDQTSRGSETLSGIATVIDIIKTQYVQNSAIII